MCMDVEVVKFWRTCKLAPAIYSNTAPWPDIFEDEKKECTGAYYLSSASFIQMYMHVYTIVYY